MQKIYWICLIVLLFNMSCLRSVSVDEVKQKLDKLTVLGTVEYKLNKVLIAEDHQWYSIGDRNVIIQFSARLKAGIDLKKITINDISSNSISITLPKPEIIMLDIDPDEVKYVYQRVSLARSDFSSKDLNDIMIKGEKEIYEKVEALGILNEASISAKMFLENWLKLNGFDKVEFKINRA